MTTKKSKSPVHSSDALAAIDEELNAAMDVLDATNIKVTEILGATEQEFANSGFPGSAGAEAHAASEEDSDDAESERDDRGNGRSGRAPQRAS